MAKPKSIMKIEIWENRGGVNVWMDNPGLYLEDVRAIDGVRDVEVDVFGALSARVYDPRYDIQDVAAEVEKVLRPLIDVPDTFKE